MYVRSRAVSVLFKVILIGFVVYGVATVLAEAGDSSLRYFTVQSNILVGCVTLYLLLERLGSRGKGGGTRRLSTYLRGLAMLSISVTCIVFYVMLAPKIEEPLGLESHVLHLIVPVGFVLDWLLFARKGAFRFVHIPVWVAVPLAYLIVTLAVAEWDGFYPYPFMDAPEIGWGMVVVNALVLLVGFSILGAIYVAVDRLLAKRRARRA